MLGLAVLLGLGNWIGLSDRPPTVSSPARFDTHLLELDAATTVRRPNYNYSVIPGGAFTGHELQRAVDRDAVVAEHYSDVNASTMRPEILKADRMAYVSYRLGSRVYWTSKKVRIRSGETILTNGQTQIRARCGNCISMEPLMPTSADEPDAMQLDALSDSGPMQLEALNDTGPVLMAWPLNPLVPVPPGGPVGVELAPSVTPQFGLPLFPVPSGFSEPTAGDRGDVDPGSPTPGAPFDAGPGERVDTSMPTGVVPPGGAVPPAGAVPPGGTPAAGTDPSTRYRTNWARFFGRRAVSARPTRPAPQRPHYPGYTAHPSGRSDAGTRTGNAAIGRWRHRRTDCATLAFRQVVTRTRHSAESGAIR